MSPRLRLPRCSRPRPRRLLPVQIPNHQGSTAPTLGVVGSTLYLAYPANNVIGTLVYVSTNDGVNWSGEQPITGAATKAAPVFTQIVTPYGNRTFLFYLANDGTNDLKYVSTSDGSSWTAPALAGGHASAVTPGVTQLGDEGIALVYTANNPSGTLLEMVSEDEGNFWAYEHTIEQIAWSVPATATGCGWLGSNTTLTYGQTMWSCDGTNALSLQTDGNLVLFNGTKAVWSTGTNNGFAAVMQIDGNFEMYDQYENRVWSTNTRSSGAALAIQPDDNMVIYTGETGGTALWATGTLPPPPPPPLPPSFTFDVQGSASSWGSVNFDAPMTVNQDGSVSWTPRMHCSSLFSGYNYTLDIDFPGRSGVVELKGTVGQNDTTFPPGPAPSADTVTWLKGNYASFRGMTPGWRLSISDDLGNGHNGGTGGGSVCGAGETYGQYPVCCFYGGEHDFAPQYACSSVAAVSEAYGRHPGPGWSCYAEKCP